MYNYTGKAELTRQLIWIGTDTFPLNPDPVLQVITRGAIRVEPASDAESYDSDKNLMDSFRAWINLLTLNDLPVHSWTDE